MRLSVDHARAERTIGAATPLGIQNPAKLWAYIDGMIRTAVQDAFAMWLKLLEHQLARQPAAEGTHHGLPQV